MPDLFLSVLDLFGDTKWGWIALTVALLSLAFGFFTNIITGGRRGDLTRDELRLLRAFKEQAQGDPRAYLSVEFAATYKAGVGEYDVKLRVKRARLPAGLQHQSRLFRSSPGLDHRR